MRRSVRLAEGVSAVVQWQGMKSAMKHVKKRITSEGILRQEVLDLSDAEFRRLWPDSHRRECREALARLLQQVVSHPNEAKSHERED